MNHLEHSEVLSQTSRRDREGNLNLIFTKNDKGKKTESKRQEKKEPTVVEDHTPLGDKSTVAVELPG